MQDEYEAVANAILAAGLAPEPTSVPWKFRAEFLEYGDDIGDCQLIVFAEKHTGGDAKRLTFDKGEIRPCMDRLKELADAIAFTFNAIDGMRQNELDAWYVQSECNWWHEDGEESDDINGVTTIQWCIFNG